jgi:hypothetical protein
MPERSGLLFVSVLFFAFLAKDITVPALVLAGMAGLRWLGSGDIPFKFMKEAVK